MITVRMTAEVKDDRKVVLTLPQDVPTGIAEFVVTVDSPSRTQRPLRGVAAEAIRGIAAGNGAPPDDALIEQWMQERHTEKYG